MPTVAANLYAIAGLFGHVAVAGVAVWLYLVFHPSRRYRADHIDVAGWCAVGAFLAGIVCAVAASVVRSLA